MTTRYVNTASSPGGDGTTNATSGANRAYASLSEAESGLPASLSDSWRIVCEGSAADTTAVTFSGVTTSASNYIEVWTDPNATNGRHAGVWSTNNYRLSVTDSSGIICTSTYYLRLTGLQVSIVRFGSTGELIALDFRCGSTQSSVIHISACILYGPGASNYACKAIAAFRFSNLYIYNCVMYDWVQNFNTFGLGVESYQVTTAVFNCTVQNCTTGTWSESSDAITAKNCLFRSCTTAASGTFAAGTDYNATDNASIGYTVTGGGNTHDRTSQTFTFVNEASDDFHLASSDAGAKDFGVSDPGAGLFSDDIDGQTRSGSWDIGADEYVAGGGIEGQASLTQDTQSLSSTGTVSISGEATITQAAQTVAATGTIPISGEAALQQADQGISAVGAMPIAGETNLTQGAQGISATGIMPLAGAAVIAQSAQTASGLGDVAVSGEAAISQDADSLAAAGTVAISGEVVLSQDANTISASSGDNQGSLDISQGAQTILATGDVAISGDANIAQAGQTATAAGLMPISGATNLTQSAQTLISSGAVGNSGTANISQAEQTVSATGVIAIQGLANITQAAQTIIATGFITRLVDAPHTSIHIRPSAFTIVGGFGSGSGPSMSQSGFLQGVGIYQ